MYNLLACAKKDGYYKRHLGITAQWSAPALYTQPLLIQSRGNCELKLARGGGIERSGEAESSI